MVAFAVPYVAVTVDLVDDWWWTFRVKKSILYLVNTENSLTQGPSSSWLPAIISSVSTSWRATEPFSDDNVAYYYYNHNESSISTTATQKQRAASNKWDNRLDSCCNIDLRLLLDLHELTNSCGHHCFIRNNVLLLLAETTPSWNSNERCPPNVSLHNY